MFQEEDAIVWARYSSVQFDQGAGRYACNNPYNHDIDDVLAGDLQKNGKSRRLHTIISWIDNSFFDGCGYCTHYNCRMIFGPNFYTMAGSKINTIDIADLINILFVNTKQGFTLIYLKYHRQLEFRVFAASRIIADIYGSIFGNNIDESEQFRKMHADAIMYWNALNEFEPLGLHKDTASCRFEK